MADTIGSAGTYPYCTTCGGFHPVSTGGCPIILPRPAVPPTPTSVEKALDELARWPQSMNRDEFLADVEVLLTAARADVRSSMLREVRGHVCDAIQAHGLRTASPEAIVGWNRAVNLVLDVFDRLAGLAKMEGK